MHGDMGLSFAFVTPTSALNNANATSTGSLSGVALTAGSLTDSNGQSLVIGSNTLTNAFQSQSLGRLLNL